MYPEAGGSSSFARHAFNEFWSFFAAWGQMLNYIITVAISAFFVPHYLSVFWPALHHGPGDIIGGIVVVILLGALNIVGVKEAAGLNIFLALADFATQLVLVVVGLVLVFSPSTLVHNIHLGTFPTISNFLIAIPVGMVAYTGIETISNMAEEARDYGHTIPRSIAGVVIAVIAIYAFLPSVALSAMPVVNGHTQLASTYAADPILGVVKNIDLGALQRPAEIYVGILAATILFIATNAGVIGVSRLTYSMGQHRQLPERLRQLHPIFRTPYIAIIVFGLIAIVTILPGQADFLGKMYAFGAMLSFTIAHLAVIQLRVKEPDRERPYRGPGQIRIAGRQLPLFAIGGGLGTGIAWIVVIVQKTGPRWAGLGWLAVGLVAYVAYRYVLYRRNQGLTLTQTAKIVVPKPVVEREVEYESILAAFEDDDYAPEAIQTAVKLAARRRRGIHVLVLITVPTTSPITASLPEQEARAVATIDSARVIGGRRVTGHWEKVRPGEAGRRIVEEARAIRARAIVMSAPKRRPAGSLFGRTLETVLAERPARVIIEASPDGVTHGGVPEPRRMAAV
jgi:APA family basic amino acid/polyamine antiporter